MSYAEPPRLNTASASGAERFACTLRNSGRGAAWVRIHGELDIASAPEFTQTVHEALERALLIIVDLRPLTFIDSRGLFAIVTADARARASGHRLVLIREAGQISRLLELTGLIDRLKFVDLTSDCVAGQMGPEASASDAA